MQNNGKQKYGIMIMSGFAALWFAWGLSAITPSPGLLLLVPLAISGTIMALAMRLEIHATPAERRAVGRVVGWASGIEGVAILVANVTLASTGHGGFVAPATCCIVGLHFLPLAYGLGVRNYYASAAAMVLLAAASCAIPDEHARLLAVGTGAAAVLWLTSLSVFGGGARHMANAM